PVPVEPNRRALAVGFDKSRLGVPVRERVRPEGDAPGLRGSAGATYNPHTEPLPQGVELWLELLMSGLQGGNVEAVVVEEGELATGGRAEVSGAELNRGDWLLYTAVETVE